MKWHSLVLIALLSLPQLSHADNRNDKIKTLPNDGILRLYAYHLNEFREFHYRDGAGNWIESEYQKICKILRSRGDGLVLPVEKALIELADHIQDHFGADSVEIISGYRSSDFNKSLKDDGRNVAEQSLHIQGKAMDIHLDEIDERALRDYLVDLGLGGVGYYGNILMVHMDLGPVRQWHSGDFKENTEIGIFNKDSTLKIRTDKLYYKSSSQLKISADRVDVKATLALQKFYRGQWVEAAGDQASSPYGKFRYVYKKGTEWQNSNEFYIKK